MKQVFLMGDSIRIGYQATVASELAGLAEIVGREENGSNSKHTRARLDAWLEGVDPDIVHINCGLHDIARTPKNAKNNAIPPELYEENLESIVSRLRERTHADILWATTTPVDEEKHAVKGFDRFDDDVVAYNDIARQVMERLRVPINDLYAFVREIGPDKIWDYDGCHYTEEGKAILGRRVAEVLRAIL